ncbi:MAG: hypothetical protein DMG06_05325 [Acidobacteria bacterium]|nr:MAG: hypothetical protein DMG06_05325 [Acidobacteriota bacterium]
MNLDVRLPIACLFLIVGLLLVGYGILHPHPEVTVKPGFNVNLCWGSVMVLFAIALWAGAKWSRRRKG